MGIDRFFSSIEDNIITKDFSEKHQQDGHDVVADFFCPTPESRKLFNPDFTVWVNTIESSRFSDTNKVFVKPTKIDIEVKTKYADY